MSDKTGSSRLLLRVATGIALTLTLYGVGGDFLHGFNILFMKVPCQRPNEIAAISGYAIPIILPLSLGLQGYALLRSQLSTLLLAAGLPATLWIVHSVSNTWDTRLQLECKARPLAEAIKFCRANRAYYRPGTTTNGYPSLTLIAPGDTDQAYSCLSQWAANRGEPELSVDQSVYDHYNRTHRP